MHVTIVTRDEQLATTLRQAILRIGCRCDHLALNDPAALQQRLRDDASRVGTILLVADESIPDPAGFVRELHAQLSVPVIVLGQAAAANEVLDILHAGADDFLLLTDDFDRQLQNALDRLKPDDDEDGPSSGLMVVASASGGAGVSVTASNLAVLMARRHASAALLDYALGRSAQAALFDASPGRNVSDLCRNAAKLDEALLKQALHRMDCGVSLLAAPGEAADLQHVRVESLDQILSLAARHFPRCVVDLDDVYSIGRLPTLLREATVVLLSRLDVPSLWQTKRAFQWLENHGVDRQRIVPVANRQGVRNEVCITKFAKLLDVQKMYALPDDPLAVTEAVNLGVPVVQEHPRARFSLAIDQLHQHLEQCVSPVNGEAIPQEGKSQLQSASVTEQMKKVFSQVSWLNRMA